MLIKTPSVLKPEEVQHVYQSMHSNILPFSLLPPMKIEISKARSQLIQPHGMVAEMINNGLVAS